MSDSEPRPGAHWRDGTSLQLAAQAVVVVAGGWWMLGELASVLRPLLIAVFLCYVLMPSYTRLRRRGVPTPITIAVLAGTAILAIMLVSLFAYANVIALAEDGPALQAQALTMFHELKGSFGDNLPAWMTDGRSNDSDRSAQNLAGRLQSWLQIAANAALGGLVEAAVAGLYLLFLLLGAERLPNRVRNAYEPDEAERILQIAGRINSAIISYLKAKFLSSLIFAVPVWLVLTLFGVKFAVLWAVLTFACNFIPYVGSVVAYSLPVAFAMLQYGGSGTAFGVAAALLAIHLVCAMLIEPMLIGRAVGLSPLIVLAALAVWGLVWGLPGMVLAVPLTVVVKIVFENIEMTRPIAKLVEE